MNLLSYERALRNHSSPFDTKGVDVIYKLKLAWKLAIITLLTPIAIIAVSFVGNHSSSRLKAEYDNLYGFMLIPIVHIDEANLNAALLKTNLYQLSSVDLGIDERREIADTIRARDKKIQDIINEYKVEYLTTTNQKFTDVLVRLERTDLQDQEAAALRKFNTAWQGYVVPRDLLLGGKPVDFASVDSSLADLQAALDELVTVNLAFAEISNTTAQQTIANMRMSIWITGILLTALAVLLGNYISRNIIRPIRSLTTTTQQLAQGDLDVSILVRSRDETGIMADAFREMVVYQKEMAAAAGRLAFGDMTVDIKPKSPKDVLGTAFQGSRAGHQPDRGHHSAGGARYFVAE
jgi:methyl-accepting chemotaxis protein